MAAGLCLAVALALFISPHASSKPDGLEMVAAENGIDQSVTEHAFAGSPTADYQVEGIDDDGLSTGVAGVAGVGVVFGLTAAVFFALRRNSSPAG